MTDHLVFLAIIAICVTIVLWYLHNERLEATGEQGILALKPDPEDLDESTKRSGPRYRVKPRLAQRGRDMRSVDSRKAINTAPAYHMRDDTDQTYQRFRHQIDIRYRIKDKISYNENKATKG